ncbi:MAG: Ig-like domain-containing protein [Bacteroidales bacterium]
MKAVTRERGIAFCVKLRDSVLTVLLTLLPLFVLGSTPVISTVTPPANGTYKVGDNIDITVEFDQSVNVSGLPYIQITFNSGAANASYQGGTGSTSIIFRYTVATNDEDNDGIAIISPIVLNGGTVQNAGAEDATLTFTSPDASGVLVDGMAPSGYSVSIDQAYINNANKTSLSFTFAGAEVGSTYSYTIGSDGGGTDVTGTGVIATATDQITGVDVSGLNDGTLTLSVTLTDVYSNTGVSATDNVAKDVAAPSGYSVSIDQAYINNANKTSFSFTFDGAEVGSTYSYTISSDGGGADVTGSGVIATATDQITGVDVSGLNDGTLTLSVTLTDVYSNTGAPATDNVAKDIEAPSGYSVSIDQAYINNANKTSFSFTFDGAEVGSTYSYTISSDGGGSDVTGTGVIATATDQITGVDVSGLNDGTLTLSVTLTDVYSNTGVAATDNVAKDIEAPSGYSVSIDQAYINNANKTSFSFIFDGAEVGATYSYTISSDGGGVDVTGTGVIATATDQITGVDVSGLNDGPLTLSFTLTDVYSNTGVAATDNIDKDVVAPSAPTVSGISAGSYNTDKTFTVTGEVGATFEYSLDDGINWNVYTGAETLSAENTYEVVARQTDAAGNTSVNSVTIVVTIDKTAPSAPTVSGISAGSYNTDKTFTVTGEVGATLEYSLDNGTSWNVYTGAETLSAEDTYEVVAHQTDAAGNTSASSATIVVTIDKTTQTPTLIAPATGSASSSSFDISFTLPEAAKSGTVIMKFEDQDDYYYDRYIVFNSNFETAGTHTTTLDATDLSNNANVASVYTDPAGADNKLFDGTVYTVTIQYQDLQGNTIASVNSTDVFYSGNPPTADIVDVTPDPRNTNAGTVEVSFSWRVIISDVNKSDFILTRDGVNVDISGIPAITYSDINTHSPQTARYYYLDLSSVTANEGTYVLTLDASIANIQDRFGNILMDDASDTWVNDLTKPSITSITSSETSPTKAATIPVTIQFSETVYNFEEGDISVTNATKSNFVAVDGDTYTFDLTPLSDGSVTINIVADACNDLAGNGSNAATEFSIVSDKTVPILSSVGITSNNSNPLYAKVNDIITLTFTGSEPLFEKPTVTIAGNLIDATDIINSSGIWTATYQMTNSDDEGLVAFSIAFEDLAGNVGTSVSAVTDGSYVEFYKNPPTLDVVTIASNHTLSSRARVGSIVTINFHSGTKLTNVTSTIANHSATVTNPSGDKKTWVATYTMAAGDTEGTIPFTINFTDNPGNAGATVVSTTNGSSVIFDKTNPELNAVTIASNNSHSDYVGVGGIVTLTITGSENLEIVSGDVLIEGNNATITGSGKNWTASYTLQSGDPAAVSFSINYKDLAGNSGTLVSSTTNGSSVTFDEVGPDLSSIHIQSNNTNNTAYAKVGDVVTLSFTSSESIESVISTINSKSAVVINTSGNNWTATYTMSTLDVGGGTLPFTITFKDYAGNVSDPNPIETTTDGSTVIFDVTAPSAPSKPDLVVTFDTGNSDTDNITSSTTPDFSGSAEIGSTVKLYSSIKGLLGTATADATTGEWTITSSFLDEGTHSITATATDGAGNTSASSSSLSVTVDNTVPASPSVPDLDSGSDTGSSNSDNYTSVSTPVFIGTAEPNSVVSVYNGATLLGSSTTNTFGAWSFTSPALTEGSYSISATSTDLAGNVSIASASLTVNIDLNIPATPDAPDLDSSSDSGVSTDNVTNDNTPTFIGTAESGSIVKLYNGAVEIGSGTATGGNWSITSSVLSDGAKSITVTASDISGNVSPSSAILSVTIDTGTPAKPGVPDLSSDSGISSTDNLTNVSASTFIGTAEANSTVNLYSSVNGLVGTTTADATGAWTITSSALAEEIHDITVVATDQAANSSVASNPLSVTIDTQNPVISSATVLAGVYKVGDIITVTLQADDKTYTGQTIRINATDQTLVNNSDNTYKVSYQVQENDNEQSAIGNLPINIVLLDKAGNANAALTSAIVQGGTLTIDSKTPQILSLTSDAESAGILKIGDQLIFTLTPTVSETGLIITPTTYNGKTIVWGTTDGGVTYTATYTVADGDTDQETPLQLGDVTISDVAGNTGSILNYSAIAKQIYGTKPTVRITGTTTRCDYAEPTVPITFTLTGKKPYTFTYSDGTENHTVTDLNADSYVIDVLRGTFTLVDIVDATGNTNSSAIENATITVNPLPVVTLNITGSPYTLNSSKDELSKYVQPTDKRTGTFSGEGVGYLSGAYYFYPSIIPEEKQDQYLPIIYTYTDATTGCIGKDTSEVYVSSTPINILSLSSVYCEYATKDTVDGVLPDGYTGVFQVFDSDGNLYGSGWAQVDSITLTLTPTSFEVGSYTVKYTSYKWPSLEQVSYITKSFTVEGKATGISISGLDNAYCYNTLGSDITFSAVGFTSESGDKGHFSGSTSVFSFTTDSHSARFKYNSALSEQDYTVSYYYESKNGCISDPVSHTLHINPLPQLSFNLQDNYNYNQGTIPLVGNYTSTEYLFSGEGVSRDTLFTSAARIDAPIIITYSYTDANGCSNQLVDTTIIYKATETIQNLSSIYCYPHSAVSISCVPNISDTITGVFSSYRNAVESSGKNTALYYVDRAGSGKDTVWYSYKINGVDYSVYKEVTVDSIGEVIISSLDTSYCTSVAKDEILGTQSYLLGGTASFTYSGTSSAFEKLGSSAEIYPYKESPGTYSITYTFTSNNGCQASASKSFKINAIPLPEFASTTPSNAFISGDPIVLSGNYGTGVFSFSGTGVVDNTFYPSNTQVGDIVLTYYVKDVYGCENQTSKTIHVLQSDASISGIPDNGWACYYSDTLILSGSSTDGLAGGEFIGDGIENGGLGADKAYFYPKLVGGGEHTVRYKYKYTDGNTDLWVDAKIKVDSSDVVAISGFNDDLAYCKNDQTVTLLSNYSSAVFEGNGIVGNKFYPSDANVGVNRITGQYTNTQSGCTISSYTDVNVKAIPTVGFTVENTCTDLQTIPVVYTNETLYDGTISQWQWYLDGSNDDPVSDYNASKIYTTSGSKRVTLVATTSEGCSSSLEQIIDVGKGASASFVYYNDCFSSIAPTRFESTSDTSSIQTYTWLINDETIGEKTIDYTFPNTGEFDVKLIVESKEHCKDSITKQISIKPVIKITDYADNAYYQDFEGEVTDWFVKKDDETDYSSWNLGTPAGDIISSDSKTWFTEVSLSNQHVENSQVLSPCFDFDTLSRPMIKFDIWSSPEEGRDGAVLQYSLDGGISWESFGDVGEGINWFNSNSIKSKPAADFLGWSKSTDGWVSARHNLESLKGKSLVRFRIVYAADAQAIQAFNGFAFDNVWIGNKQQNVLFEYFTNSNLTDAQSYRSNIETVEDDLSSDIIPLHYHTNYISGDPLYQYYPNGPSSRVYFYSVSQIPYAFANGNAEFTFPSGLNTTTYFAALGDSIDVKSLNDPKVDIDIVGSRSGSACNFDINLSNNVDLTGNNLLLQCALVKSEIEVGGVTYNNVLRNFIPDAGGTVIGNNLGLGNSQTISLSWTPSSNDDLINSKIIAFVQNLNTNEVYQSATYDLSPLTGISPVDINSLVSVYPNPAVDNLLVVCQSSINQVNLYDVTGRLVDVYTPNQDQLTIPVQHLRNGIYILKGKTDKGEFVKKFIKQ